MSQMLKPLSLSACWVAAARAVETERTDRLFNDPWAAELAGADGMAGFLRLNSTSPDNPGLAIRTRHFDDLLLAAVAGGAEQVVLLAAGLDTRCFRLSWPAPLQVFELDLPAVTLHRESVLAHQALPPRLLRRVISADLRDDWGEALRQAGFSSARRAVILVEGLLVYLPDEPAVTALLRTIAKLAAPRSVIGLDLVGESFLDACVTLPYRELLRELGTPWTFGTDNPEGLLARAGFSNVSVVEPWQVDHGRWPFPKFPRSMLGIPRSYFVRAEVPS